jgi:hypothetical protein
MRLVTRADLDGLTCAVLLSTCEVVEAIELVHPQDVAERRVAVTADDILTNVPYHPACGMWFDNHLLTDPRATPPVGFRLDSASLSMQDVLHPEGFILIGLTLDARTGLDGLHDYFRLLYPAVRDRPLGEVLELSPVRERAARMREQDRAFREKARERSRLEGDVLVTDFRGLDPLPVGNRFLVFTLFPDASVSLRLQAAPDGRVSISAGRSIFNRTSRANLGVLLSLHGGGGHPAAAATLVPADEADRRLQAILAALRRNG